jgi:hypothetical protein
VRKERSRPLLAALEIWLREQRSKLSGLAMTPAEQGLISVKATASRRRQSCIVEDRFLAANSLRG